MSDKKAPGADPATSDVAKPIEKVAEKLIKQEKLEKVEVKEKAEKIELKEKPEKAEHKEKPEKVEVKEKPEKTEHKEKPEKIEHKEKPEKTEHKEIKETLKAELPEKQIAKEKESFKAELPEKQAVKEKDGKELVEVPSGDPSDPVEQRLAALEQGMAAVNHFITTGQRPDLSRGALAGEPDAKKR